MTAGSCEALVPARSSVRRDRAGVGVASNGALMRGRTVHSALWQRKRHERSTGRRAVLAASAGDDDVLLAVHHVNRWRGVARRGKLRLPQQFARSLVERVEFL